MSIDLSIPAIVPNQVGGHDRAAADNRTFSKKDPANGRECCRVARSAAADVQSAVACAKKAQPAWAATTVVKRGEILRRIAILADRYAAGRKGEALAAWPDARVKTRVAKLAGFV